MDERRYNDEEVAEIFRAATEGTPSVPSRQPGAEGLTLAELQEIGQDVGIGPEAVARAAISLDVRAQGVSRRLLGFPIGVGRSVALNRWLSDAEWEQLVVELRDVFQARGTLKADGSLRQWTNGNLHVLLEPTPTGHRLRLGTFRESARVSILAGIAVLGAAAAVAVAGAVGGELANALPGVAFLALAGLGMGAYGALRLPGWARLREQQMEGIIARLAAPASGMLSGESDNPPDRSHRR